MEALDQLLMACHSQSIKPFVESFLHMVAKLLESREPDLQVLGTNSVRRLELFLSGCKEELRLCPVLSAAGLTGSTANKGLWELMWEREFPGFVRW